MAADYLEHLQQAADAALESMRQHAVVPNALNYSVWLAHHAGSHPALSAAIRAMEAQGEAFDELRHLELAERFLGRVADLRDLCEVAGRADGALAAIAHELGGFRRDASLYDAALDGAAASLGATSHLVELSSLVTALRASTEEIQVRTSAFEGELARRDAELSALRVQLEQAERAISSDPLTGIGNRRLFEASLRRLCEEATRGVPLALLMVDIDHFKQFNDTHGHPLGDLVLKLVARRLDERAPPPNLAARYGGEEFAVLLPATPLAAAAAVAERIRAEVAGREVVIRSERRRLGVVTLSIGVAAFRPGEPTEAFVARADKALYRAKAMGRNRIETESSAAAVA